MLEKILKLLKLKWPEKYRIKKRINKIIYSLTVVFISIVGGFVYLKMVKDVFFLIVTLPIYFVFGLMLILLLQVLIALAEGSSEG